jgi:hypothetical protein
MAHLRRDVDHRAAARLAVGGFEHLLHGELRGEEGGAHVEVEQPVEMRLADLDERLGDVEAGVVDQDVELLQAADGRAERA